MATVFSKIEIMNAALREVGSDVFVSDNDGSLEFDTLNAAWPFIVEAELEEGGYRFSNAEVTLSSRIAGKFGFEDGYAIPADVLHIRGLFIESNGGRVVPEWVSDDGYVYVNEPASVIISYVLAADPSVFGANFAAGIKHSLQASLCRTFLLDEGRAQVFEKKAMNSFGKARMVSARQQGRHRGIPNDNFRIIGARRRSRV